LGGLGGKWIKGQNGYGSGAKAHPNVAYQRRNQVGFRSLGFLIIQGHLWVTTTTNIKTGKSGGTREQKRTFGGSKRMRFFGGGGKRLGAKKAVKGKTH